MSRGRKSKIAFLSEKKYSPGEMDKNLCQDVKAYKAFKLFLLLFNSAGFTWSANQPDRGQRYHPGHSQTIFEVQ